MIELHVFECYGCHYRETGSGEQGDRLPIGWVRAKLYAQGAVKAIHFCEKCKDHIGKRG